jgi:hypothetical protein
MADENAPTLQELWEQLERERISAQERANAVEAKRDEAMTNAKVAQEVRLGSQRLPAYVVRSLSSCACRHSMWSARNG